MSDINRIVGQNIDRVRNNTPYRKFSDEIYKKTGIRIGVATLQQYVTTVREPKNDKLEVIAQFAEKPISWFYLDHSTNKQNQTYSLNTDTLPKEIFEIETEYLMLAKEMQDKQISPDEIKDILKNIDK